jgi:tetratricopeptide (TPR) repeat protein
MPIHTDKDLSEKTRSLWLKALSAIELKNFSYAVSLLQAVLKDSPAFLDGRKMLRRAQIAATRGKRSMLSGLSTASLKGAGMVKKDPLAAMELAEKNLESDPYNSQANHLLKDAANAAGFPEVASFALETLVDGNPKDTKLMHELGEHYNKLGEADKAVAIFTKIAELNPSDLAAVKKSKDASARASMKSGGWEQVASSDGKLDYRSLIKNKDEAVLLEQKNRVVKSTEMIDTQLGELYPQWEQNQDNADISRRMAKLYEDRYMIENDAESMSAAIYYFQHTNDVLKGTDPAVARKLSELQMKQLENSIKALEDWLEAYAEQSPDDAVKAGEDLAALKAQQAELLISEAKKRVERNPTDLQLRYELGEQLVHAGQYTEAIAELQQARRNPNARLKAMNLLGQCYTEKGMLDLAVKQFKDAASEIIAMDITKKEILYKLGLVYERMGKRDESLDCMKEIYEVDYGYMDVAKRVESSYNAA